ncbi:unnamed protein product, partial [Prunus brigantina]
HLHSFQSAVGCKGLTDEGQCLLFPSSLSEAALNWFYRLEPGTVDSFDELKQIFLNHFMIQTDRLYSADDLEKTSPYGSMLRASVTSTQGVRKRTTGQPTAPSRVAYGPLTFGT